MLVGAEESVSLSLELGRFGHVRKGESFAQLDFDQRKLIQIRDLARNVDTIWSAQIASLIVHVACAGDAAVHTLKVHLRAGERFSISVSDNEKEKNVDDDDDDDSKNHNHHN